MPPLRPWQRWLYAAIACGGGGLMTVAGAIQFIALLRALRSLPPVVTVDTGMCGLFLMGIAIAGFGTLALFPVTTDPAIGRRASRGRRLNHAQRVTALGLVCLLLLPVSVGMLRWQTSAYLTDRHYRQERVDPGFHSRVLSIRWVREDRSAPHL